MKTGLVKTYHFLSRLKKATSDKKSFFVQILGSEELLEKCL